MASAIVNAFNNGSSTASRLSPYGGLAGGAPYELVPTPLSYPAYYTSNTSLLSWISDKDLSLLTPVVLYWVASGFWEVIDNSHIAFFDKYRLHEPEEVKRRNRVSAKTVFFAVILQQVLQTALGYFALDENEAVQEALRDHRIGLQSYGAFISRVAFLLLGPGMGAKALRYCGAEATSFMYWWGVPTIQFFFASFLLDTWQYFFHRAFHTNKFLYRHFHSHHHRLYCPYAFGALYNHPLEGFVLDTVGTVLAHHFSGMTTRQAILLFGISTLKTVDDHCGFALPFDPLQVFFGNNAAYHDIHHQQFGIKANFSQPYFTHWDTLLSTRMTPEQVPEKHRERYHAGPCKDLSDKLKDAALKAVDAVLPDAATSSKTE